MKRRARALAFFAVALGVPAAVQAAEVTRVASSMEDKDPFGMYLDVAFVRTQELAKITRDWHQDGDVKQVTELRYKGVDSRLQMDAHIGLWRDLEFHVGVPLVFADTETWDYAAETSAAKSTIANNCLNPDGSLLNPSCPDTGAGKRPMFPVPGTSYRGGVGNVQLGLAYAFFSQAKDDTKPTWVASFQYDAPSATQLNPSKATSSVSRGNIGDRVHKYTLSTAISRKIGTIEPYFKLQWMFPAVGPGYYSNCDFLDNLSRPENCTNGSWSRRDVGIKPPSQGGVFFGAELNAFEQETLHQRLAFDIRGIANYVSGGRYYNELSGELRKLLTSEEYLQVGGVVGIVAQAADYVAFKANGTLLYSTPHALTAEAPGRDLDGNGTVNVEPGSPEANPTFDYRTDLVSRRFRVSEVAIWRIDVSATFSF